MRIRLMTVILLLMIMAGVIHAGKISTLKENFDFGINVFDYDFRLSDMDFEDFYKLLIFNEKIEVQSELLVNKVFYSKDKAEMLNRIEARLGTDYLQGKEISNVDFILTMIRFMNIYLMEDKYVADAVDIMREFNILEKLYKKNPWIYLINAVSVYSLSKEKILAEYELSFYEKVEYALYNGGDSAKLHYSVANFFKRTGRKNPSAHKLAVIEYQKAVNLEPENRVLQTIVLKNLSEIMEVYRLHATEIPVWLEEMVYKYTIRINPDDAYAYNNLAYLYSSRMEKPEEALENAEKAFSIRPEDPYILDTLALCNMIKGKFEKARKYFEKAYNKDPRNKDLLKHMSDFYLIMKQNALAVKFLKEYIEIAKEDMEAKNNLAYLLSTEEKELGLAHDLINEVLVSTEKDREIYLDTLGWILYKKKRYTDSLEVFERIEKVNDSEILRHRAYVYAKLSMYEEALRDIRTAIVHSPQDDILLKNYVYLFNLIHKNDKIGFMKDFIWEK